MIEFHGGILYENFLKTMVKCKYMDESKSEQKSHRRMQISKFPDRQLICGCQGVGGAGNGDESLNRYGVFLWGDEKTVETIKKRWLYNIENALSTTE